MYDLRRESWQRKRALQDALTAVLDSYGYQFLETPLLEGTELFLRQSGGDLASRMYSFVDAGSNQVSLRPEFTSPIMRHFLEGVGGHDGDAPLPARFQYAGPVFRYDVAHPEGSGQFTQVGAELIGAPGVMADAELLTLAASLADRAGVADCAIELADLDVFHSLLDVTRISDRARGFILASIPQLRQGPEALPDIRERAYQLHLNDRNSEYHELSAAITGLADEQARQVIQGFLRWNSTDIRRFGQREPEQVVDRFLRKLRGTDEMGRLEQGLELAARLATIRGEPGYAVAATRELAASAGVESPALDRLEELLEVLESCAETRGRVTVDFGLARGIAYYNGIVFELRHPDWPAPLGGGGRYDGLARALGSPFDVPALGFAYTLETLLALADWQEGQGNNSGNASATLVAAESVSDTGAAFGEARRLREQGITVEMEVGGRDLAQARDLARRKNIRRLVYVHSGGELTTHNVE